MVRRKLLYVGLALLALAAVSLVLSIGPKAQRQVIEARVAGAELTPEAQEPIPVPGDGGAAAPPATDTPATAEASAAPSTPEPTVVYFYIAPVTNLAEVEWPTQIEFGRSESIRVSLVRRQEESQAPTVSQTGHALQDATTVPVGTPEMPLEAAFGLDYEGCASANLVGATFDIKALNTECQSLQMDTITWEWNITPKAAGPQVVNVNIEAVWKPTEGQGKEIRRQVWRAQLDMRVTKPLIAVDQLHLFTGLDGLLGSVLSVPWIYDRIKDFRAKKKDKAG